jgi:cysteine synthase A
MYDSVLEAVGSPLVAVRSPEGATVAAKLEAFNPGGSAKDRPAAAMVAAAERAGELSPGDRVVEPTSGNTGIGLAVVCATRGYDLTLVMPASKSEERRRLMRAYGADIELVEGDISTARERADDLEAAGAVQLRQFENEANVEAHYRTTGEEILDQVDGREVDALVASVGTGGTITGTARRLLEANPETEVVAVEPAENAVLSTGEPGDDDFQGMGPGFVSELLETDLLDSVETVDLSAAEAECRRLAREEGILVGQSSGAASLAAQRVAERLAEPTRDCPPAPDPAAIDGLRGVPEHDGGRVRSDGGPASDAGGASSELRSDGGEDEYDDCPLVVTIFPDSGERYLSTGLFDG